MTEALFDLPTDQQLYSDAYGAWLRDMKPRIARWKAAAGPWVVVPCSGSKAPGAVLPAGERYTGPLHLLAMQAARALTDECRIWIASARYGLMDLTRPAAMYDQRIDGLSADDARVLRGRMQGGGVDMRDADPDAPIIALVPSSYLEVMRAIPIFRGLVAPLEGCGGIGVMRQRLARIRDTGSVDV